jgi:predicted transcriptional regulator of viral defense system
MKVSDFRYTGISGPGRTLLRRLTRARKLFTVSEAAAITGLDRPVAGRLLAHWASRGWLARLRRGLYAPVPLDADPRAENVADAWAVLSRVFAPCYIGGWSACEHWGLTEQLFRTIVVVTARRVVAREGEIAGARYLAKRVAADFLFGTRKVWREGLAVEVSDQERTVVDVLDSPEIGGGMRHVASVVAVYFRSDDRKEQQLLDYGVRLGNRTVFKRLGFLIERLGIHAPQTVSFCLRNVSKGYSLLDPSGPRKGRLVRRWNLRLNVRVTDRE